MSGKKHTPPGGPNTGKGFVDLAKNRGAKITENAHAGFTSIETANGKMYMNPSHDNLDKKTRSNIRRWFRFLGLMSLALVIAKVLFPFVLPVLNGIFL